MPVLFGEKPDKEGWVAVTGIQYLIDSHDNGYSIKNEDILKPPLRKKGKNFTHFYHPERNEWRFDEVDVPLTQEEIFEDLVEAVRELTAVIKERM